MNRNTKREIIMAILNAFDVQPNSDKRNEFLVVLDYLLTHTSDEKHATSQTDIVKYAKNEYELDIRRDRIPQILLHLSQLTDKYPEKFPFKLKTVKPKSSGDKSDGAWRKYYISERAFSDKEILKIVSAIQSDKTISSEATDTLVNKFLKETASEDKIVELKKKLEKKQRKTSKYTDRGMGFLEMLEDLADKEERIWFSIKDYDDVDFDIRSYSFSRELSKNKELHGYIYSVLEVNNNFVAVIYLPDYRHAMITPITNVVVLSHLDLKDISDAIDYTLDNDRYGSIDEWVEKHYKGQDGNLINFEFKFTLDGVPEKEIQYISSSFRKHWKQTMEYSVVERDAEILQFDETNNELKSTIVTVRDAYVNVRTTIQSFRHWYMDYKIFSQVVIVSPSRMNDMLLGPLMNRLVRRMSKYGSRYDYELKRTPKDEYREFLERNEIRRRRRQEIIRDERVEGIPNKYK